MKIPKIQNATDLRSNLYDTLKEVASGNDPHVITHKGGDEVILLSKRRYNNMAQAEQDNHILRAIAEGKEAVEKGDYLNHEDAKEFLRGLKTK